MQVGDAKGKEHSRAVSLALSRHTRRIGHLRTHARVEADEALEDALKQAENRSEELSSRRRTVAEIRWRAVEAAVRWVDTALEASRRGSERRRGHRRERRQQRAGGTGADGQIACHGPLRSVGLRACALFSPSPVHDVMMRLPPANEPPPITATNASVKIEHDSFVIPAATLGDFESTALEEQRGWLVRVRERRREATEKARRIITEHVAEIVHRHQLQDEREQEEDEARSGGDGTPAGGIAHAARDHSQHPGEERQQKPKSFDADDDGGGGGSGDGGDGGDGGRDSEDTDDLEEDPPPLDESGGLRAEALAALAAAQASCLSGIDAWAEDLRCRAGALKDSWTAEAAADDRRERGAAEAELEALGLALRAARQEADAAFAAPCSASLSPLSGTGGGAVGVGAGDAAGVEGAETAAGPRNLAVAAASEEVAAATKAAAAAGAVKGGESGAPMAAGFIAEEREECSSLWSGLERQPLARLLLLLQPEQLSPPPLEMAGLSRTRERDGQREEEEEEEEEEESSSATRFIGGLESELRGEVAEAFGAATGTGERDEEEEEEEVRSMLRAGGEQLSLALVPIFEGRRERRETRRRERKQRDLELLLAEEEEQRRRKEREEEALEAQRAEEALLRDMEREKETEKQEENGEERGKEKETETEKEEENGEKEE